MIKWLIRSFFLWCIITSLATNLIFGAGAPMNITLQATLASSSGTLEGRYAIDVEIVEGITGTVKWKERHKAVLFINGTCSIILGNITALEKNVFNIENATFWVNVHIGRDIKQAIIPIPSTPYAIQAKVAETVDFVDAKNVVGEFTSTVNINAPLIVDTDTLYVDTIRKRVGVGTTVPSYSMHVDGIINAKEFLVNGKKIQNTLHWKKNESNNNLYYNEGNVGIATANPLFELDVAGTINAKEYLINSVPLKEVISQALSWEDASGDSIWFSGNNIGIGTNTPQEKLHVNGGIRIGKAINPRSGTIEYKKISQTGTNPYYDFIGHTGSGPISLTGIQGSAPTGSIGIWDDDIRGKGSLTGSTLFSYSTTTNSVGIGVETPEARLHILATDNITALHIKNDTKSLFIVSTENVGIGTDNPQKKLDVNGGVNAHQYYIDGIPLAMKLSTDTFWLRQNEDRIYYDIGNVGIGTTEPRGLLELASQEGKDATFIFDIGGEDKFTMGVSHLNPDAFIISKGSDLNTPVFSFKGEKIGIGLQSPSANLQVSGNTGVLVTGKFRDKILGDIPNLPIHKKSPNLIFYPPKAAFRAGYFSNNEWSLTGISPNVGDYSSAMGFQSIAKGIASSVGGGYSNKALGNYSTVPGGFENKANGQYSFAAGYKANAKKSGSFVWSDYIPSGNYFESTISNQFLIKATNGVGIGTTDTSTSELTIIKNSANKFLLKAEGNSNDSVFSVNTKGQVAIGTTNISTDSTAKLVVTGGGVSIGTSNSLADLTVQYKNTNSASQDPTKDLILYVQKEDGSPAFFINKDGQVGIGVNPFTTPIDPDTAILVNGAIIGTSFQIYSPDNPDAVVTLKSNPGSPWSTANVNKDDLNEDIFFTGGNVGIGTPSPNSLFVISDRGELSPYITFEYWDDFDEKGIDQFTMGPTRSMFVFHEGSDIGENPVLSITTTNVGIGTKYITPSANFHVSGNAIFDGKLLVGTSNIDHIYDTYIDGNINVSQLYINGVEFKQKNTPWESTSTAVFIEDLNVGIGTNTPQSRLEVIGTIKATTLNISGVTTITDGIINIKSLELRDEDDPDKTGLLEVTDQGQLQYSHGTTTKILSSPIRLADPDELDPDGTGEWGKLAYWVTNDAIGETDIIWRKSPKELIISGNFSVTNSYTSDDGFSVQTRAEYIPTQNLNLVATLTHLGSNTSPQSFTGENVDINIQKNWGHLTDRIAIKGLDIAIKTEANATLLNNASATGLYIDVTELELDASTNSQKNAAIFLGGNVGIGTNEPTAELEVNGTVSANFFNLSGGLDVISLSIGNDSFKASKESGNPRVGIGSSFPATELDVNGTISANSLLISGGLTTTTLNVSNGTIFVNSEGNVGIGTSEPDGQIEIKKEFTSSPDDNFTAQKININLDGSQREDIEFFYSKDITGLEVDLNSAEGSQLQAGQTATGVSINLTNLTLEPNSKAIGLDVDVSHPEEKPDGTRYAAIFKGGNVGIGTTNPQAALHVSGDIIATNIQLTRSLIGVNATFNNMIVHQSATFNGTVTTNQLNVTGELTAGTLKLSSSLIAPDATFATLNTTAASINQLLKTAELRTSTANITSGFFSTSLAIGTTSNQTGLTVSGNFIADNGLITNTLTLSSATMNINTNKLFISPKENNYVGINTKTPTAQLHVNIDGTRSYDPETTSSWQAIKLQNNQNKGNAAVGILMIPNEAITTSTIGSGIVAVKSSAEFDGSHLTFITDPENGIIQERVRITSEGNVGINTTTPLAKFQVNGDSIFDGDLTVENQLSAQILESTSGTITINSELIIEQTASINNNLNINEGLYFNASTPPSTIADYGVLYMGTDNDLYFKTNLATVNISQRYTGDEHKIPYIDIHGTLKDDAPLAWNNSTNTLKIGTANQTSTVIHTSTIGETITGTLNIEAIHLNFSTRDATVETLITGLAINADSLGTPLGVNDIYTGVKVDFRDMEKRKGTKVAASFLGGFVGIGTEKPSAALEIQQVSTENILMVSSTDQENVLFIDKDGLIGMGTNIPSSRLTIQGNDDITSLFDIYKNTAPNPTGPPVFFVGADGKIGVNTNQPSSDIHIVGTLNATTAVIDTISGKKINLANNSLVVSGNKVGIGTESPNHALHIYKEFTGSTGTPFIAQKIDVQLSGGTATEPIFYDQNITGLDILGQSNNDSAIDNDNIYIGSNIDLSNMALGENARLIGLQVNVTKPNPNSDSNPNRYAAIFNGGNVGINTSSPNATLDVNGSLSTSTLIVGGQLNIGTANFTNLEVSGPATFNNQVTINSLAILNTLTVDTVSMSGNLNASTANITTINAKSVQFDTLVIGTPSPLEDINPYNLFITGNAYVSGNFEVDGSMTISTLKAGNSLSNIITVNATTVNFLANTEIINNISLSGGLIFTSANVAPTVEEDQVALYLDSEQNLMVKTKKGAAVTTHNLTNPFTGQANAIPFYDDNGNLTDQSTLFFSTEVNNNSNDVHTFQVGTANTFTNVKFTNTIPNNQETSSNTTEINLKLPANIINDTTDTNFTALDINFEPTAGDVYLDENQKLIGLDIDLSTIQTIHSDALAAGSGTDSIGYKYAGLFHGGLVGIGTKTPKASLHVTSLSDKEAPFRVDLSSGGTGTPENAFIVSEKGFVGIATANPTAYLSIKQSNTDENMIIYGNSGTTQLILDESGNLGIATSNPTAKLSVEGDINFNDKIVFKENGNVGFGTTAPAAALHIESTTAVDILNINKKALFINADGNVGIGGIDAPQFDLQVNGVIAGGDIIGTLPNMSTGFLATTKNTQEDYLFFGFDTTGSKVINWDDDKLIFNSTNNLVIDQTGNIGIGASSPDAYLTISSNATRSAPLVNIKKNDASIALKIAETGHVGIGTDSNAAVSVNIGSFRSDTLVADTITINNTLTTETLVINKLATNTNTTANSINLTLQDYSINELTGLDIILRSQATDSTLGASILAGNAYGVRVDMSGLETGLLGKKYAATFVGGNVGIGSAEPKYALDVVGNRDSGDIARFSSSEASLVVKDFQNETIGFFVEETGVGNPNMNIAFKGKVVGIAVPSSETDTFTTELADKGGLLVNGNTRLGIKTTDATFLGTNPGTNSLVNGARLYFDGTKGGTGSEGDIYMGRYNGTTTSNLRIVLPSTAETINNFQIGMDQGGTFLPGFVVHTSTVGNTDTQSVGIADNSVGPAFEPETTLHVKGTKSGDSTNPYNHIVTFENTATDGDILALWFDHNKVSNETNFISFFAGNSSTSLVGAIEGNINAGGDTNATGIRFVTRGADYAEYLEKLNPKETFEKGQVVGVFNGKITKNTNNADQILVLSTDASIAGNMPDASEEANYELVAFFGQVPVSVTGPVSKGDYLIPSNQHDGSAIAVTAADLDNIDHNHIIGRAWGESTDQNTKKITAAVGFHFSLPPLKDKFAAIKSLESTLDQLKSEQETMIKDLDSKLKEQDKQIEALLKELKQTKN